MTEQEKSIEEKLAAADAKVRRRCALLLMYCCSER